MAVTTQEFANQISQPNNSSFDASVGNLSRVTDLSQQSLTRPEVSGSRVRQSNPDVQQNSQTTTVLDTAFSLGSDALAQNLIQQAVRDLSVEVVAFEGTLPAGRNIEFSELESFQKQTNQSLTIASSSEYSLASNRLPNATSVLGATSVSEVTSSLIDLPGIEVIALAA